MSMHIVFRALADENRRRLLDNLHANNGQTLSELTNDLSMTRQAVTKHLHILEQANLVVSRKVGRNKFHYLNPIPIQQIAERWIDKFEQSRLSLLLDLKKTLEGEPDEE